ncbi:Serine/threonine-protein kinase NLK [Labeo rohita]|uniref:Serine/threonine-protein kinase NLK n=1 Tax=Labeo rohita TaxID=84645 RepID=A0ABQ8M2A5_LABRO|nr:Serine/threonine-protein kinase NLK [Labeo rohita]
MRPFTSSAGCWSLTHRSGSLQRTPWRTRTWTRGRLRYHTCMCKCCYTTSSGRVYTSDFEPVTNPKFDDGFEKNLTSVRQVKEIIHQFILEQQKGNRVPLCINPQSAAFKSFISMGVTEDSGEDGVDNSEGGRPSGGPSRVHPSPPPGLLTPRHP